MTYIELYFIAQSQSLNPKRWVKLNYTLTWQKLDKTFITLPNSYIIITVIVKVDNSWERQGIAVNIYIQMHNRNCKHHPFQDRYYKRKYDRKEVECNSQK